MDGVDEKIGGYLGMIDTAAGQLADLLEELVLAARIEAGRWDPLLTEVHSLELARDAVRPLGDAVAVDGTGTDVAVELTAAQRGLHALARCALRHGGLERVELRVEGPALLISPVTVETAAICLGRELRDFDAAVAVRAFEALGGTTEEEPDGLRLRLPLAPALG